MPTWAPTAPIWMIQVPSLSFHTIPVSIRLTDPRLPGFFSVQVLEEALNVWGLKFVILFFLPIAISNLSSLYPSLVRWRSEQMRPYQQTPQYVPPLPLLLPIFLLPPSPLSFFPLHPTHPPPSPPSSTQLAFILNLQQHWFTLRRFGHAEPNMDNHAGNDNGHWFNLNSFLPAPDWVSKLYLGMVLQQAEAEGTCIRSLIDHLVI